MAAAHFTKIPGKPNIPNRHIESHICEIRPCTNNIAYAKFEVFRTFLHVFISDFGILHANNYG